MMVANIFCPFLHRRIRWEDYFIKTSLKAVHTNVDFLLRQSKSVIATKTSVTHISVLTGNPCSIQIRIFESIFELEYSKIAFLECI